MQREKIGGEDNTNYMRNDMDKDTNSKEGQTYERGLSVT